MNAIIMVLTQKECNLLFNGSMSMIARKSMPKKLSFPFKVYVYKKKHKGGKAIINEVLNNVYGGGKVVGEFVCETFITDKTCGKDALFNGAACLTQEEAEKYSCGKVIYGLHITKPKRYDTPKELCEFTPWCEKSRNTDDNLEMCCNCKNAFFDEDGAFFGCGVTRPPQSWMYVEEIEE